MLFLAGESEQHLQAVKMPGIEQQLPEGVGEGGEGAAPHGPTCKRAVARAVA